MENKSKGSPNCIFIIADHLRYDVLGKGYTPHIDELMGDSVSFPHAYCGSPLCVPARGTLFTGTYPSRNGSVINGWFQPEKVYSKVKAEIDNLYDMMERLDMECIHSGKQHLFVEGEPLELREGTRTKWLTTEDTYRKLMRGEGRHMPGGEGFRTGVPEMRDGVHTRVVNYSNATTGRYEEDAKYYFDQYFTEAAVKELENYDGEKPLYLSMMYVAPHPPFEIPDPWYSMVKAEDAYIPDNVGKWYPGQSPLQKYNLTGVIGSGYSMEQWNESWRVYLGLVTLLDDCVGEIIGALKAKGAYDNSLIVFGSDHGEMLGSHSLFQKMCMYEESARTPLSIHVPGGVNAGKVVEEYVSHIDVFPTICDFYGVTPENPVDGKSLRETLVGDKPVEERPVFIQYDGNASRGNYQRCVVWNKHKLIVDLFKDEIFYELYDLEHDVLETRNLLLEEDESGANANLAATMHGMLKQHLAELQDMVGAGELNLNEFLENYSNL